jgi:hypothetical protein
MAKRPLPANGAPEVAARAYLLVLSRYERGARRFVELPAPSVLAWFRAAWGRSAGARRRELGGDVYGLGSVFDAAREEGRAAPPVSDDELCAFIERTLYVEGGHEVRSHYIAVETDDDEVPIHYYLFDEDFLRTPDAWDELPDWRTGTALRVIEDPGAEEDLDEDDEDEDDEDEDDEDDDDEDAAYDDAPGLRRPRGPDAFETFYRRRSGRQA